MSGARDVADDSVWSAVLGLFMWLVTLGLSLACVILLSRFGRAVGVDLQATWRRGDPFLELATLVVCVLLLVAFILYAGMCLSAAFLKPFIAEPSLRRLFLNNLGCHFHRWKPVKWCLALDRFNARVFDGLFVRRPAA